MSQGFTKSFTGATSAQMAAGTAANVAVTPAVIKYAPGVAKAWVVFDGSGTAAISTSHNVASLTDNGTGDYTITFTTPFSTANYVWAGGAFKSSVNATVKGDTTTAPTAASCRINVTDGSNTLIDPTYCSLVFFGTQ